MNNVDTPFGRLNAQVPDTLGPAPALCIARIQDWDNLDPISGYPPDVNVAPALSYSIWVQTPNGLLTDIVGVIPAVERWPPPNLVQAFQIGEYVPACIMDGKLFLMVKEDRWAAPCDWEPVVPPPPAPPPQFPIDPRVGNPFPGTFPINPEIPSQ